MNSHNIFYIPPHLFRSNEVTIKGSHLRHVINVLRKRRGEQIALTDGQGYEYQAEICDIRESSLVARILKKQYIPRKFSLEIAVGFVPVKGLRNDSLIEKGTQLGVTRFISFASEHSVVKNVGTQKIERWKKIAQSAIVQSQQYHVPEIAFARNIEEMTRISAGYDITLVAEPSGNAMVTLGARSVMFLVGPEGGFSESERDFLTEQGASLLSLGPTRLRSETAAIVGVSKILAAYGLI